MIHGGSEGKHNPPWLFGLLTIPYGTTNAIVVILMPYLLRKQGVAVDRIASAVAFAIIPNVWYFLYSPLVDIGLRRRSWILLAAVTAAICSGLAVLEVPGSLTWLTILLFLQNAVAGLLSPATGALMTELQPSARGQASGWANAGNLGGGAVSGGIVIWLADSASLPVVAAGVAALILMPALAAFLIQESQHPRAALVPLLANMFHELRDLLRSPRTLIGLVFFLSPVGSAAIGNLISGVGPDYHASGQEVMLVSGIAGGLLSALGSLAGGYVCGRVNRMVLYALAGGLAALFAAYLAFAPPTAWTYGAGYCGYAIAAGFAYAVFTALVLDVLGRRRHAAGTAYSLLTASGNIPIAYMTWLDGVGYKWRGPTGLMGVDALANAGGAVLLLVLAFYARRLWTGGATVMERVEEAES